MLCDVIGQRQVVTVRGETQSIELSDEEEARSNEVE